MHSLYRRRTSELSDTTHKTETLEVEFVNGRVYQYYGVPDQIHAQFMEAPSKGQFLNYYVKNHYPYSRVG